MNSIRISIALIAFFFVLLSVSTAQAGPLITARGQTMCILGGGNGTDFDYEIRPEGGGTPFCSGTLNFSGTQAQFVADLVAEINFCASDVGAYPTETLPSFTCPVGETGFTIARDEDSVNFEFAVEPISAPGTLVVPIFAGFVESNPRFRPPTGNDKPIPCNGSNACCGGESPPCNPVPVPEPGLVASLLSGSFLLFGLNRLRRR